jgi:hypothetical protein
MSLTTLGIKMTMEDYKINLFNSECIRLDTFIRMYCSTGYSDREICSVLSQILKELVKSQPDPAGAMDQLIEQLKRSE